MAIEAQRYINNGSDPLEQAPPMQEDMLVQLPEEMDIQGESTAEFEVSADGQVIPIMQTEEIIATEHNVNLADVLEDSELRSISSELTAAYEEDKSSREEWLTTFSEGLDLLGIKSEARDMPFPGASGVTHPILSEAATQFQAQAYKELLPAGGPVKTQTVGDENSELSAQSRRVKEFMNYQITEVMQEYDPDMDSLLFYLPLAGSAFKKVYFDSLLNRATSSFIKAEDLVVSNAIKRSLQRYRHWFGWNTGI